MNVEIALAFAGVAGAVVGKLFDLAISAMGWGMQRHIARVDQVEEQQIEQATQHGRELARIREDSHARLQTMREQWDARVNQLQRDHSLRLMTLEKQAVTKEDVAALWKRLNEIYDKIVEAYTK